MTSFENIFGPPAHRIVWVWKNGTISQVRDCAKFMKTLPDIVDASGVFGHDVYNRRPEVRDSDIVLLVNVRMRERTVQNAEDLVNLYATLWWNQYEGNPNRAVVAPEALETDRERMDDVPYDSTESG